MCGTVPHFLGIWCEETQDVQKSDPSSLPGFGPVQLYNLTALGFFLCLNIHNFSLFVDENAKSLRAARQPLSCEWAVVTWSEPGCFPRVKVQAGKCLSALEHTHCCMEHISQHLWILHLTEPAILFAS